MKNYYWKTLLAAMAFLIGTMGVYGQSRTVSGTVNDSEGEPLPGANILVKNTKRGTTTDFDGKFTLEVMADDKALVISFVGFESKTVKLKDGINNLNITMKEAGQLQEVVVTALDMKRSEEALGYSVQSIDAKDISDVKVSNINNKLSGRVAGVYVSGSGNGPTASTNVTIRGQTSLTGSSQALYVVNGMPITNGLFSPGDGLNGSTTVDFGNASQVINPDDVESMSVLKGPAAAALYGSRAANGVILITTKNGENTEGFNVEVNTQTMAQSILQKPNFQNEYGFGGNGYYSYNGGNTYTANGGVNYYDAFGENWGPKMDGQNIKQFNTNGEAKPFTPAEDNFDNFFETGMINTNNIAISDRDENGDFRISYTNLNSDGIVPNSNLTRHTAYTSVGRTLFDKRLDVRMNLFYINSSSDNIPNGGYDESSSIMYGWLWYPRQVGVDELRNYWRDGQEDEQQRYVEELWVNNPWMVAYENTNSFTENRILGNAIANYHINDRMNIRVRYGLDQKEEQREFRRATSTKGLPGQFGSFRRDNLSFNENNTEAILGYSSDKFNGSAFNFDVKVGGNIMRQSSNILVANNTQLLLPGQFTLTNNRTDIQVDNRRAAKGINSAFGIASFSYDSWIYLDVTARNDWSSTLPEDNNSYFYPSASLSTVISDKVDFGDLPLSFLKVRAAYAEVGSDTDPFLLNNTYEPRPLFGDRAAFSNNTFATNPNLLPERTTSFEVGFDARFYNNRLRVDATYYNMLSEDQIIFLPVATASGKETRLTNAGSIRSTGFELQITGDIIRNSDFGWTSSLNLGHNSAIVESLPAGIEGSYPIIPDVYPGDEGSQDLELVAVEGKKLGQLRGLGFQRDAEGSIIHENGVPLLTEEKVLAGSYQPDLRLGWQNTFTYKRFSLGILIDGQTGGNIYSRGHALFNTAGGITNEDDPNLDLTTLEGRQEYDISYQNGVPIYAPRNGTGSGVVGPGVMRDANGDLVANDVAVTPREYFYAYYGNGFNRDNIEAATYDATWFKLREVRIAFNMPQKWFENSLIKSMNVALIGRNLLLVTDVPTIDPETFSIRNGLFVNGFGSNPLPSTRSYGISISAKL